MTTINAAAIFSPMGISVPTILILKNHFLAMLAPGYAQFPNSFHNLFHMKLLSRMFWS
jgi:hypothetical protein